jgi:acetylornithine deacetylase/succinyl-diaminopimelate desuccinylase-like protein
MKDVLIFLDKQRGRMFDDLAELVAVPSISPGGRNQRDIARSAKVTCDQMRRADLKNVRVLQTGGSNPFAYGEWTGAGRGKPTLLLYAHHDVQPIGPTADWKSDPWTLTRRRGRLFGRGSADDKGAIVAQLSAIGAWLNTRGELPVNVKVLIEGEEEIGSKNLFAFFKRYAKLIRADAVVVCDTENVEAGLPCVTYSLRGGVSAVVTVRTAEGPRHSGMTGGWLPDAAVALNVILARLFWDNGKLPIPRIYDGVKPMTAQERRWLKQLPGDEKTWRKELGLLKGVRFANRLDPREQTWRQPAVTITAQEASAMATRSPQVLNTATAAVSVRTVAGQDPDHVGACLRRVLEKDPPWNAKVDVQIGKGAPAWMTDPTGPAFDAARDALRVGFNREPAMIGCGGSIGFIGPLCDLLGGAPALMLGIEDPDSKAHAPNESLNEADFLKLTRSIAHLFERFAEVRTRTVLRSREI